MTDNSQSKEFVFRHRVIKEVVDRPGSVVHVDEIAETLDLRPSQVADAIRGYKKSNPEVGNDIQVVIAGRSWRYVPNGDVIRAIRATNKSKTGRSSARSDGDRTIPLTTAIKKYFAENVGRTIFLNELCEMMSTDDEPLAEEKVKAGLNNAKVSSTEFKTALNTVIAGQAWIYDPVTKTAPVMPPVNDRPRLQPPAPPASTPPIASLVSTAPAAPPVAVSAPPVAAEPTPSDSTQSDDIMLFEKIGEDNNGAILVRNENKQVFRLLPL